jgi:hypothetical protein
MTAYFYFAMAVITMDFQWFLNISQWENTERALLVIILTPSLSTDIYVIYEALKKKNKTRI